MKEIKQNLNVQSRGAKEEKVERESDPKRLTMDKKTLPNALD